MPIIARRMNDSCASSPAVYRWFKSLLQESAVPLAVAWPGAPVPILDTPIKHRERAYGLSDAHINFVPDNRKIDRLGQESVSTAGQQRHRDLVDVLRESSVLSQLPRRSRDRSMWVRHDRAPCIRSRRPNKTKTAGSGCSTADRAPGTLTAVSATRRSCGKAGKARIFTSRRDSSGESRLRKFQCNFMIKG